VHTGLLRSTHADGIVNREREKDKTHEKFLFVQGIDHRCTWHPEAEGKIENLQESDGLWKNTRMFQ